MDPQALAQATVDAIKPLYDKYAVVINTMIRTNPDGVRTFVTRDVLVKALTDGAPVGTSAETIEKVADYALANFNPTVNALLVGCRSGDIERLTGLYKEALA
jgi:hypothetical protein